MSQSHRAEEIVFYDLETTIPPTDVIEFGAIVLDRKGFYEKESYSTLLRSNLIDQRSMDCNGITPAMVDDAPGFADIADRIHDILDGRIWAGHNIEGFDNKRIFEQFERLGRTPPAAAHVIDTLGLLRRTFGKRAGNMKLASLGAYFGLGVERHRSIEDVRMNIEVLKSCAMTIFLEENAGLVRTGAQEELRPEAPQDVLLARVRRAMATSADIWISYSRGTNPLVPRRVRPLEWVHEPVLFKAYCHQSQTEKHFTQRRIVEIRDEAWELAPDVVAGD